MPKRGAGSQVEWEIEADYYTWCNCDWGCPCNFNARPTDGTCHGGGVWRVRKGHFGETDLKGAKFAVFYWFPGLIENGNGRARNYVDRKATPEQRKALGAILSGKEGGGILEVLVSPVVDALPSPAEGKAAAMSLLHSFYCWGQVGVVLGLDLVDRALRQVAVHALAPQGGQARPPAHAPATLVLGELAGEGVLLLDLRAAPASRPVELEHARRAVVQPYLVDAVFVAVQREQPAVGAQPGRIAGVEHDVGGEGRVRMRRGRMRMRHGGIVSPWRKTSSKSGTCISPTGICRSCAACRWTFRAAMWSASWAAAAAASRRS